jgi:hypothetical protein
VEDPLDAYAAGLVDGEGTITLSRNHRGKMRCPVISMTSTTREMLQFMQERYGGSIRVQRTYGENHSTAYIWSAQYNRAIDTLQRIRPYLLVPEKIRRADLILQTYKSVTPRNGKYDAKTAIARHAFELEFFHPSTP